jgi:hypothetical protein
MGLKIKVNDLGLSHKGSNGFVRNTLPDVCKTPSPGGPVPIPYPVILSRSGDLANGTTTVTADGGNMISIKGSEYSRCNGDEPGTAGGVKSSTNMREAKWILYSFDVKFDGGNVCRYTDKMTMNHENTVCLGGDFEIPVLAGTTKADLEDIAKKCNRRVNRAEGYSASERPSGHECTRLGTLKHKCCEDSIKEYNESHPDSPLRSEQGYNSAGPLADGAASEARQAANNAYQSAIAGEMGGGATLAAARAAVREAGVWITAFMSSGGRGDFIADVVRLRDPAAGAAKSNIQGAYDFKFNCADEGSMSDDQLQDYKDYTGKVPQIIHVPGHMF